MPQTSDDDKPTVAEMDQAIALLGDQLPRMWRSIYEGCLDSGFTEPEAMRMILAYIQRPGG